MLVGLLLLSLTDGYGTKSGNVTHCAHPKNERKLDMVAEVKAKSLASTLFLTSSIASRGGNILPLSASFDVHEANRTCHHYVLKSNQCRYWELWGGARVEVFAV